MSPVLCWDLLDLQTLPCYGTQGFLFQIDHLRVQPLGKLILDKLEGVGHTRYADVTEIHTIIMDDYLESSMTTNLRLNAYSTMAMQRSGRYHEFY
jgi:hypothetical protein